MKTLFNKLCFWRETQPTKPTFKPRVLVIPAEDVKEVLHLCDIFERARSGPASHEARYDLWKCLTDIFPEAKDGSWTLDLSGTLKVKLREKA